MKDCPLSGLRVLDVGRYVSGPYCSKLLADFGAEVIKIESPNGGDISRCCGPFPGDAPDPERSGLFLHLNTNKKSITLDWQSEAGGEILQKLILQADVLVENYDPGVLDCQSLRELNPSLILTSISYFGQDGPYRDYKGADIVAQAVGGTMKLTGLPDRQPLKIAGPQAEYQAGLNAAVATMTALYLRDETGMGQHIDISVIEVLASILEGALLSYSYNRALRKRDGARHRMLHPSTILPCKNGYVHIDAGGDWETFARFLEIPELLRYEPEEARQKADEVEAQLIPWLASREAEEIFHRAQEWRLPFAMVLGADQLPADQQLRARGFFVDIDHPIAGRLTYPGAPFKMSENTWKAGRAPLLGEHNREIYSSSEYRVASFAATGTGRGTQDSRLKTQDSKLAGLPLEGLRIIDLSQVYAGPYAGKLLADMGAEVIKIESAVRSSRGGRKPQTGAVYPDGEPGERPYNRSAYYNELNRNKYAVGLDLSGEQGREVFGKLVRISDVVVENFSPRVMANFGLDYPTLRQIKPEIIMVSISAYGQTGPYRDYVSFGRGIEAMTGLSQITGYEDSPPLGPGIAYADATAGLHAAFATLVALHHRRRTGKGQHIDLSLRESLIPLLGEHVLDYSMNRRSPQRRGNRDSSVMFQGCYRCRGDDAWIAIAICDDGEWSAFCNALGNPPWTVEERFATSAGRQQDQGELDRNIEQWTIEHESDEATCILQQAGIRAGTVRSADELSRDSHLQDRGFLEMVTHPEAGTHAHPGISWKLSHAPGRIRMPAPCFAEHNDYVFGELLGMPKEQLDKLAEEGVIARVPLR